MVIAVTWPTSIPPSAKRGTGSWLDWKTSLCGWTRSTAYAYAGGKGRTGGGEMPPTEAIGPESKDDEQAGRLSVHAQQIVVSAIQPKPIVSIRRHAQIDGRLQLKIEGRAHRSTGLNPQVDTVPIEVGVGGDVPGNCGHRPRVDSRQRLFPIRDRQQHVGHDVAPDGLSVDRVSSLVALGFAALTGLAPARSHDPRPSRSGFSAVQVMPQPPQHSRPAGDQFHRI